MGKGVAKELNAGALGSDRPGLESSLHQLQAGRPLPSYVTSVSDFFPSVNQKQ